MNDNIFTVGGDDYELSNQEIAAILGKRKSFTLYMDKVEAAYKYLNEEQFSELSRMIVRRALYHEVSESKDNLVNIAFNSIASGMDIDEKKYIVTCIANKENGKLGGRPKRIIE